ncbi:DUF4493 domain-containing protein [Mediterranea massiliensis]|uniref:DUF4493 domain-containing protein n=1 Tax=Mediterranea massiliensis TaxID=1841865 RepID=UPI003209C741
MNTKTMLAAHFGSIQWHLFLFTAIIILLYGCERNESDLTNGYGTLALRLEADNQLIELGNSTQTKSLSDTLQTAITRSSDDIPNVEDFELYMYANGVLTEYWETFSTYDPTQQFSVGNYELKAVYGAIDKEGFFSPYYEGTTNLQIKNRENTEAEITCKLSNVKVSITCTDAVKKYFKTFSMQLRSELNNPVEIGKDETRSVYLKPGLLVLNAQFEKQNGTSKNLELLRIEETEGQQHYLINVDVNNGEVGSGTLQITYNTVQAEETKEIDLSDASLNIKEPVFTTQGFENGASMTLREGAQPEAMKVTLNARAGIQTCELCISSPYLKSLGIPETIDLASQNEEQKAAKQMLVDKGLRLIGLNDEIGNLALIDFTSLIMNLVCTEGAEETSTFLLKATDTGGRTQETEVSFSMTMQGNQFSFPEITDPVMIGSTEATVNIRLLTSEGSLSGQTDVENVIFEYQNEAGEWISTTTKWAGDDMDDPALHYAKIQNLPPVHTLLSIRARYGSKTSATNQLSYYIPDFTLTADEADIWARKATVKITAGNEAELKSVLKFMQLSHNGSPIAELNENTATYTWEGLNPGTSYPLAATCNGEKSAEYSLTTEAATQLPNSDFEQWQSGPYDGETINMGGPWSKKAGTAATWGRATYQTLLLDVKEPTGWCTINDKTMPQTASQINTWYITPSTNKVTSIVNTGTTSVCIRNVGWNNNGKEIELYGTEAWFGTYYDDFSEVGFQKLNIPETLNYSAGRLFLGSYSYDHSNGTEIYNEGIEFQSRPSQMKFQYKYVSKIDETRDDAYIKVALKNNEDILFETYVELDHTTNVLTKTINFTYPENCKKATTICVMFCSSKDGKDMDQSKETNTISHYDIGTSEYKEQCCVTGSELYIDNIELIY